MAQETWALKLDAELKEKLQGIIKDDFESSKDFMEQVVSLYELDKLKEGENVLSAEVDELESLTRRINGIFINANAKINTMLQDKDIKSVEQQELKQKLIERLQNDIAKLEQEKEQVSSINDLLVVANEEYKQKENQLTKSNQMLEDLVAEYKEKNDLLTGTLTEYKSEHEQNKLLQVQIRELEEKLHDLNLVCTEQSKQILESDTKLKDQADKQADEMNTTKAKSELEANMKLLEMQAEYQSKVQALQEKHNAEIEEYQKKYRELLEKLEQGKANTRTTKAKNTKNNSTTDEAKQMRLNAAGENE